MNCCLQKFTTHQFTYFIYYLFQDKFKYPKIIKIQRVHQEIHAKQFLLFYLNCLLLATHLNSRNATDLVTRQHDSRENVKEFIVTSPHIMPRPIVSRLETRTLNSRCEP